MFREKKEKKKKGSDLTCLEIPASLNFSECYEREEERETISNLHDSNWALLAVH